MRLSNLLAVVMDTTALKPVKGIELLILVQELENICQAWRENKGGWYMNIIMCGAMDSVISFFFFYGLNSHTICIIAHKIHT